MAQPLLLAEQDRLRAEQRAADLLPLVPAAGLPADGTSATDLAVLFCQQQRLCHGPAGVRQLHCQL
ncbi:hypothetical protein IC586_23115, partial [Escherichia coli]|nr:hypothetical protein [Escherichia coli]